MAIWLVAPVEEVPELVLISWMIVETETNERHFVGYNITLEEGRVSSAIQQFDPEQRIGITRSGRAYKLQGNPGRDSDALYVWGVWKKINGVTDWRDVTAEALAGR